MKRISVLGLLITSHIAIFSIPGSCLQHLGAVPTSSGARRLSSAATPDITCASKFIPPQRRRDQFGELLQNEGLEVGAEIGVKSGAFTQRTLRLWNKCKRYYLIDQWGPKGAGGEDPPVLKAAKELLEPWREKLVWLEEDSAAAADKIKEPLDYVYMETSHDYCTTMEDLQLYWPLIKPGGIMAGHNYENAGSVMATTGQDWALCPNGSRIESSVQGAVTDFFKAQGLTVLVTYREPTFNSWMVRKPDLAGPGQGCNWAHCGMYVPPVMFRGDYGTLLEREGGFKVGVELGVQRGEYAAHMLNTWPSGQRYYLVDLWAPQENYKDIANVPIEEQEKILNQARSNLERHKDKLVWLRNYTSIAVKEIKEPLDYVYVDARHDYCGAMEDISMYWPLIRPGGIMAGHDYENAPDVKQKSGQDWAVCMNGTRVDSAVMGAVNDFFAQEGLQVVVTYREADWNSWMVRKPLSTAVRAAADHGTFSACPKPVVKRFVGSSSGASGTSPAAASVDVVVASGTSSSSTGSSSSNNSSAELLKRLTSFLQAPGGAAGLSSSTLQGGSHEKLAGTAAVLLLGSVLWAMTGFMVMAAVFCSCVRPRVVELPGGWMLSARAGGGKTHKLPRDDV